MPDRDHLFISYAWEDAAFARWLALKLTGEGFKVWIDQFKLLGGEPYPQDIDAAIQDQTFRMLALLSQHSVNKPNPVKERTLALNIARDRKLNFLIPLNVDGLSPARLPWMTSDLTFIPFDSSWATGLRQLLKKLRSIDTPRFAESGHDVVASSFLPPSVLSDDPETLRANLFEVMDYPRHIKRFRLSRDPSRLDRKMLAKSWPHRIVEKRDGLSRSTFALAFDSPPARVIPNMRFSPAGEALWEENDDIDGIGAWNLAKPLIEKTFWKRCTSLGLKFSESARYAYFPPGLIENDNLSFDSYNGRKSYVKVTGERQFRGQDSFRYHLAFASWFLRLPGGAPFFRIGVRLHLTDMEGETLPPASALARRKAITRTWYNHEFLIRHLAIAQFLSSRTQGEGAGEQTLVIDTEPYSLQAPFGIAEDELPKGRQLFRYGPDEDEVNDD